MITGLITSTLLVCTNVAGAPLLAGMQAAPAPIVAAEAIVEPAANQPLEVAVNAADESATPVLPAPATATDLVSAPEESLSGLAFAEESDDAVVDRVISYLTDVSTLEGDFTQIAPSGAVSTGKFYLRRPGQLRFEYDEPTPLLIVATQGNVYVRDDALETTDFYPIKKTPLRFLLSKKIELDDAEVLSVDRGVESAAVTFGSTEDDIDGELSVIVRAPEVSLKEWIVRDLQNGITIVQLENLVAGEKLPNRLFRAPEAGGAFINN